MPEGTEPQAGAAPQFDMAALTAQLQQAAAQGTQQAIEGVARRNAAEQRAQQAQAATQADPIASTIMPVIAPALRELAIKGDSGRDAAVFYATTPQSHKYSGVIEQRFNELLARGIPVDRASLWNLIKGRTRSSSSRKPSRTVMRKSSAPRRLRRFAAPAAALRKARFVRPWA
jgi:hypothetical protein